MKILNLLLKKAKVSSFLLLLFALLCQFSSNAQSITVSGTVTSSDDQLPIPGVSVVVKGTKKGVSTDFDGIYTIKTEVGKTLVFSYLGMSDKSLKVKNAKMNVVLDPDVESLEEIVVIGYGTVKKKELTGAVARVDAESLEKIVTSDLGSALQGQVSGVNIVSSATPGGAPEILIRGITSLSGDNTPLYVVDGIIQDGDPRVPPSEIESINILKDAASAAIYGARGATGVILITTKKGEVGTLKVRINGSSAVQIRNAAVPLMNSTEQLFREMVTLRNTTNTLDEDYSSPTLRNPYLLQNNTDLNDLIFNDYAQTHNYNTSISGGTEDIAYNVTMGMFKQEGLQLNSAYERFNIRSNTTYKKGKFRARTSVGLSLDRRDIPRNNLLSQAIVYSPLQNGLIIDDTETIEDDTLYILGSGGTLKHLKESLGIEQPTLLGVDVWCDGALILRDAHEQQLFELIQNTKQVKIILSVIGGQGIVLGRGNQQISARIIEQLGVSALQFISTQTKLLALNGRALTVDSGSDVLNQTLAGFHKIICGYEDYVLYEITYV